MDDHAKQPDMVQWTMLDLRNAISPNRAARAPTANAYQSHGPAERSADLLLTMAVVVVAGVSGGRRVVWQ